MKLFKHFSRVLKIYQVRHLCITYKTRKRYVGKEDEFEIWKEKFPEVLLGNNNVSKESWEVLRNFEIESDPANREIIDFRLLQKFMRSDCVDAGINYYKFLESNNYNISINLIAHCLELYSIKENITDADKAHILRCYKKIPKDHLLSEFQAHGVITSLCHIDKWEEAIKVMKKFKTHDKAHLNVARDKLIKCLIRNDELKLAFHYLEECIKHGNNGDNSIYYAIFRYFLKEKDTFEKNIEKVFLFWHKYGAKPRVGVINELITVCREVGWSAQFTTVSNSTCAVCNQPVIETGISNDEFVRLYKAISKLVSPQKVYGISVPHELNRFMKFMDQHKPYDFVIDGLNIILGVGGFLTCKQFLETMKSEGKKVLFIGRTHLNKPLKTFKLLKLADYFLVNDMSKDDLFILYATFASGNGTNLISNDLMRQHKNTFHDSELSALFKRWQKIHQYTVTKLGSLQKLDGLQPIDSLIVKNGNSWHIPYSDSYCFDRLKDDVNWVCINTKPEN